MKQALEKEIIEESENRPTIMQHYVDFYVNYGGPATGYKIILNSALGKRYRFVPLIQRGAPHGLNLRLLRDLINQIRKINPDVVHIRGLLSEGFYGLLAARLAGCRRIVLSVHGFYQDNLALGWIKKSIFKIFIEPFTLKNADLVYTVCEFAAHRKEIKKYAKNFFGVIQNAAPNFSLKDSEIIRKGVRDELGISPKEIIIITVARIVIDKGYKDLIEAIKVLNNKLSYRYLIIGEGDYSNELKRDLEFEIENKTVFLLGKQSNVERYLLASDIFVFPSLHENFSNALLEACAAKLAIIATNVGGNPEIIKHNITGILIPPNNSKILAKEIIQLANNQDDRARLSCNAHKFVQDRYNIEIMLSKMNSMYESILKN